MKQIRIPMGDIDKVVCELALEQISWADTSKNYPEYVSESKDEEAEWGKVDLQKYLEIESINFNSW